MPENEIEVSVVISSYNRAESLRRAIESLFGQTFQIPYEVIVVDNNSTDATRQVLENLIGGGYPRLRYLFEPRQGVSYGRNTGVQASKAAIIAFTDDDLRATPEWLATLYRALSEHPEVEYVGGKVLPSSMAGWPSWVTREHWGPLALFDYGDQGFYVNRGRSVCLGTSNSAYRRSVFDRVGYFDTRVQAVKRRSATEDHELQLRIWRTGGQGLWVPGAIVLSDVAPDRLTKAYHRQWQARNGHLLALMRDEAIEQTRAGRLFGVPGHIYRRALQGLGRGLGRVLRGDLDRAFAHEVQLRWALGFIGTRWLDHFRRLFTREGGDFNRT
jgi:glycosyltransferase involved in cell wall biosynthesis